MQARDASTGEMVSMDSLQGALTHDALPATNAPPSSHATERIQRTRLLALLSLSRRRSSPKAPPSQSLRAEAPPPIRASPSSGLGSFLSAEGSLPSNARAITIQRLVHRALATAQEAVEHDGCGALAAAYTSYKKAVELIELALHVQREEAVDERSLEQSAVLQRHAALYRQRMAKLEQKLAHERPTGPEQPPPSNAQGEPEHWGCDDGVASPDEDRALRDARNARRRSAQLTPGSLDVPLERTLGQLSLERHTARRRGARRMSHAETGIRFFHSLRESERYLDVCVQEAEALGRVWRCVPERHPSEDAAVTIQSWLRVWHARREHRYLQTLCRLILLMDSRERNAARTIQQAWRRRQVARGGSGAAWTAAALEQMAVDRTRRRRSSVGVITPGGQMELLTPRGDGLLDIALGGGPAAAGVAMASRGVDVTPRRAVRTSIRLETPPSLATGVASRSTTGACSDRGGRLSPIDRMGPRDLGTSSSSSNILVSGGDSDDGLVGTTTPGPAGSASATRATPATTGALRRASDASDEYASILEEEEALRRLEEELRAQELAEEAAELHAAGESDLEAERAASAAWEAALELEMSPAERRRRYSELFAEEEAAIAAEEAALAALEAEQSVLVTPAARDAVRRSACLTASDLATPQAGSVPWSLSAESVAESCSSASPTLIA